MSVNKDGFGMLKRKIEEKLEQWYQSSYGLLIDGARQIGKTFIIRKFIKEHFENVVEINLIENKRAVSILSMSIDSNDFMLRLSSLISSPLVKGSTVIFIDEIQEFKSFDFVSMMKFLVEKNEYRFVVSGSLLGVEQYGIESWPEGYMIFERMYPLDFEEFLWGANVNKEVIDVIKDCFINEKEVPDYIHNQLMDLFLKYLLVGGMPKPVSSFFQTNDFNVVALDHKVIENYISKDISRYASDSDKILIQSMYDLIPSELNSQTKRFSLKDIPTKFKNENLYLSFGWFSKAGVCLPTYNVSELATPLELSSNHRLVKLFHEDVGILTYLMKNPSIKHSIMESGKDLNYGAIYENCVAQMLTASGHDRLYYYSKKGFGEVDFVIQDGDKISLIEVKSGKDYHRHLAIDNAKEAYKDRISKIYVLTNDNLKKENGVLYLPIYMAMYL